MRYGNKRIILGSTSKMGTGVNIQDRLVVLHHVDCPYRPIERRNMNITEKFSININGKLFDEREVAGNILKSLYNKLEQGKELHIGTYQGFNLLLRKSILFESHEIIINGNLKYKVDLGDSPQGNMTRIENIVKNLEERMKRSDLENSKLEYQKPFPYENEYKTKLTRQLGLNQELDLGRKEEEIVDEAENEEEIELEYIEVVGS